jgi:hypothetical protein
LKRALKKAHSRGMNQIIETVKNQTISAVDVKGLSEELAEYQKLYTPFLSDKDKVRSIKFT